MQNKTAYNGRLKTAIASYKNMYISDHITLQVSFCGLSYRTEAVRFFQSYLKSSRFNMIMSIIANALYTMREKCLRSCF